jgi:hypothetical protein
VPLQRIRGNRTGRPASRAVTGSEQRQREDAAKAATPPVPADDYCDRIYPTCAPLWKRLAEVTLRVGLGNATREEIRAAALPHHDPTIEAYLASARREFLLYLALYGIDPSTGEPIPD